MLNYNLMKRSLFDDSHSHQTPSSTYFQTDNLTRNNGVLLNIRRRLKLSKDFIYLKKMGVQLTEITPAMVLFPLSKEYEKRYY